MKKLFWLLPILFIAQVAQAQMATATEAPDINGTWLLQWIENIHANGKRDLPYGDKPTGMLVFDTAGRYTLQIYRSGRPRVTSGDKVTATPAENSALVQGSNSHFGTFKLDPAAHTITFVIDHASYPNWEGTTQVRKYELANGLLTYTVSQTTQGGAATTAKVTWARIVQ